METDVSAFILAGGRSTRMGADKAFALLNGRTLLARILDAARTLTSNVHIVGILRSTRHLHRRWKTSSPDAARWAASMPRSAPRRTT